MNVEINWIDGQDDTVIAEAVLDPNDGLWSYFVGMTLLNILALHNGATHITMALVDDSPKVSGDVEIALRTHFPA